MIIQLNRNYLIFSEDLHENLLNLLRLKLNTPKLSTLKTFHYINLKDKIIDLKKEYEISSFFLMGKIMEKLKK